WRIRLERPEPRISLPRGSHLAQIPANRLLAGIRQQYPHLNQAEKNPCFSSQISATLDLKDSKFFSRSCGAGCRSGRIRWFVTYMMGRCKREGPVVRRESGGRGVVRALWAESGPGEGTFEGVGRLTGPEAPAVGPG